MILVHIARAVEKDDHWFTLRRDAVGEISACPLMKVYRGTLSACAYGVAVDLVDVYIRIGEDTIFENMKRYQKL